MLLESEQPPIHLLQKSYQSPNVFFQLSTNIEVRKSPTPSSLSAQSLVTTNELEIQLNDINADTLKHYETDEQVIMIFDTVGNETGDGGGSDGKGNEMLLLECRKKQVI